ncbi:hypothetical protein SVAN01_09921 [Stagonosporopsis vannaccii]|nr:hypothetical protein SVAN01_09921 [Stagonosporopsis vannaccii]
MDLDQYFGVRGRQTSRDASNLENDHIQCYLPLLASPVNEGAREAMSNCTSDVENTATAKRAGGNSVTSIFAGNGRTSSSNLVVYKPHHEASSIELFYDLFFVANLAYFTSMHQHVDAPSLINYLKLFTLLWFTWLSTTLFDVRFGIDCVWNRLHKAIQFGVFTGFVFAGPVFDNYSNKYDGESFRHFAVVLIVSRVSIAIQYAVVMWQGRMFRQTLLPLGLSTAIHVAAAIAYVITLVVYRNRVVQEEQVIWVAIAIFEGLAVLFTAMIWRIVSFKYTHIVERLQLLTLIIIGEGIIGMIKSVACITKGQAKNNSTELGSVIAAVVLLYLIYMLYFDQFSEDRFGTLRQSIWSLLHYPLHMAIVICVEGNTSLIVWNSAVQALRFIWSLECEDCSNPVNDFDDVAEYTKYLNNIMIDINNRFRSKKWEEAYDWNLNFTAIQNYSDTYGFKSEIFSNKTGELVQTLFAKAQVFVFEAHADTLAKLNAVTPVDQTIAKNTHQATLHQLEAIYNVFNVTVMSFYIGAGAMVLILAILYWFNKMHKTKYEFGEIINRVVVGFALIIVGVATVIGDKSTQGFKFKVSHWMIAIVVLCFVIVLLLDNILLALSRKTSRRNARRASSRGRSTACDPDNSTLNLLLRHPYSTTTSRSPSRSAPLSRVPSTANLSLSRTRTRVLTPAHAGSGLEGGRGCSEMRLIGHNVTGSAHHVAEHVYVVAEDQIGLALSPLVPERSPSRDRENKGGEKRKGNQLGKTTVNFESGDWSDEPVSDRENMRKLGRARTS